MQMTTFDLFPDTDAEIVQKAHYDRSQMKKIARFRNAMKSANAYKVSRSSTQIVINYFKKSGEESFEIRARMVYELFPPFA